MPFTLPHSSDSVLLTPQHFSMLFADDISLAPYISFFCKTRKFADSILKNIKICFTDPFYRSTIAVSQLLTQHLVQINEAVDTRIILGDFNFPHIDWTNPSCPKRDGLGEIFQAALDDMGLFQCVTKPAYNNHILDLTLLSDLNCFIECRKSQPAFSNII